MIDCGGRLSRELYGREREPDAGVRGVEQESAKAAGDPGATAATGLLLGTLPGLSPGGLDRKSLSTAALDCSDSDESGARGEDPRRSVHADTISLQDSKGLVEPRLDEAWSDSEDADVEDEEEVDEDDVHVKMGWANDTPPLPPPVPVSLLSRSERRLVNAGSCANSSDKNTSLATMRLSARLSPQAGALDVLP